MDFILGDDAPTPVKSLNLLRRDAAELGCEFSLGLRFSRTEAVTPRRTLYF